MREKCNLEDFTHREMSIIFQRARNIGELIDVENAKFAYRSHGRLSTWDLRSFYPLGSSIGPMMLIDDELEMCQ